MVSIDAGRSRSQSRQGEKTNWRRVMERVAGVAAILAMLFTVAALATYDCNAPSWNHAALGRTRKIIGYAGACLAGALLQTFGLAAALLPLLLGDWGVRLISGFGLRRFWLKLVIAPVLLP